MRIAFYLAFDLNPQNGGIERVTNILTKEFVAAGHQVYFVSYISEPEAEHTALAADRLVLPDRKKLCSRENQTKFTDFINKNSVDIIVAQHSHDMEFATLPFLVKQNTNVKILYVFHPTPFIQSLSIADTSYPILKSERTLPRLWRRMGRIILKKQKQKSKNNKMGKHLKRLHEMGDYILVSSEKYIDSILKISNIQSREKLFAIANPNTYREEDIQTAQKENILIFVGRLSEEKHPEKIMLIWKHIQDRFPQWNLKILGEGKLKHELEELHKQMKLERCSIEGRQEPTPYYAKAKILLLASDFEGFPMTITEAMQHGVIPVAFNSFEALSGIIEENVTGISVTPYSLQEYEEKLAALMNNEEKIAKMSVATKKSISRFSAPDIAVKWIELFSKLGIR